MRFIAARETFKRATRRGRQPTLLLALLLAAALASGCTFSLAEDITPPPGSEVRPAAQTQPVEVSGPLYPLVAPDPEAGRPIYAEKCAPCHGDTGLGNGERASQLPNPVAALGAEEVARLATPADWYQQVTRGNLERFMPPFNSLSDRERWDVVAFAFSLSSPQEILEQGAEIFQAECANCHGESGRGDGPEAASLASKPKNLTDPEYVSQKSTADFFQAASQGIGESMPAFAGQLSEDQRWAVATFLRSLTFKKPGQPAAVIATAEVGASPEPPTSTTAAEATPIAAASAGFGSVSGTVTNASGLELPETMTVTLRGFDDMTVAYTQTTSMQPGGIFNFENVEMPAGRVFMATVIYKDASYGSDLGFVQEGLSEIELPITVYETTTDMGVLKADRLHLFFEFLDTSTVRVIELYVVSNTSDKTLVSESEGGPTARFNLPAAATNLEFQDGTLGGRYIEMPGGFADTSSIRPGAGSYEALFAYLMPYDRKLDLTLKMSMPVDAVVILAPEGDIKIKSDMLQDGGVRDVQGAQYRSYSGGGLAAGAELSLTLTGGPTSGGSAGIAPSDTTSLAIGLAAFGLAMVLGGVWLFRRMRKAESQEEEEPESAPEPEFESQETLMDAIIALDDLYQAGKLPEEAYQQRRSELKARLKELLDRDKE